MLRAPSRYVRVIKYIVPFSAICGLVYLFLLTVIPDHYEAASSSISSSTSSFITKGSNVVRNGFNKHISDKKTMSFLDIDLFGVIEQQHGVDEASNAYHHESSGNDQARDQQFPKQREHLYHHQNRQQRGRSMDRMLPSQQDSKDIGEEQKDTIYVKLNKTDSKSNNDSPVDRVIKANAALVMFTSEDRLQASRLTIREMEDRFNNGRNYPWIILSALPLTDRAKKSMSQLLATKEGTMTFGIVPREQLRLPKGVIDVGRVYEEDYRMMNAGIVSNRTLIGERNRWRYLSGFLGQHTLLDEYEYMWRVDPGVEVLCNVEKDPIVEMEKNGQKFAWSMSTTENKDGIPSAWKFINEFKQSHGDILSPENSEFFLTRNEEQEYTTCTIHPGLSIAYIPFLRSSAYLSFIEAIDEAGLIYYEHFSDATIITLGISLLLPRTEILHLEGIGWSLPDKQHMFCPRLPGLNKLCHCDPHPPLVPNHLSCNDYWQGIQQNSPKKVEHMECDKQGECVLYIDVKNVEDDVNDDDDETDKAVEFKQNKQSAQNHILSTE